MPETEYGAVALAEHEPENAVPDAASEEAVPAVTDEPLVEEDLLVEEVSIDGMCGVY